MTLEQRPPQKSLTDQEMLQQSEKYFGYARHNYGEDNDYAQVAATIALAGATIVLARRASAQPQILQEVSLITEPEKTGANTDAASMELRKKLHEVSGWKENGEEAGVPDYTLDFLLQKLPPELDDGEYRLKIVAAVDYPDNKWGAMYGDGIRARYRNYADTPRDVACKMAIELFEQEILKPENQQQPSRVPEYGEA